MGALTMSVAERRRLEVFGRVRDGELSVAGAAAALGISERQAWRLKARYVRAGRGVRRVRGVLPPARGAAGGVCGQGGDLPPGPGRRRRADAVRAGDENAGGGVDPGRQPAGQGAGGADERDAPGPAGEGDAAP